MYYLHQRTAYFSELPLKNKQSSAKHKEEVERENARALAKKLSETTIKLTAEAGSDGRFYGAITSKDIAEALKAQAGIEADKRKILKLKIKGEEVHDG